LVPVNENKLNRSVINKITDGLILFTDFKKFVENISAKTVDYPCFMINT